MAWISFFLFLTTSFAAELPRLLTKHSNESLRYISMDGRNAYVLKKPGVLGLVSNFRSTDFLSEDSFSDFKVQSSRFKVRLSIEVIPNKHNEYNLVKNHKIYVVHMGNTKLRDIGEGISSKLHLNDEWISYFDAYSKLIHIQNIITEKKYSIKLTPKANPFFIPQVEMISSDTLVYTDINEKGYVALVSYNLLTKKNNVLYKAPQNGSHLELCQHQDYLAIGEFPYEGINRGSKIMTMKVSPGTNLSGYSTVYSSIDQDLGNMVCLSQAIYFVKTTGQNQALTTKTTEAVKFDLKSQKLEIKSSMGNVTQLIEMDDRIIIPLRGEFYVVEGLSNLGTDTLKTVPNSNEELPLEM